ncbi:MAG: GAF domain-containing protein, partial [Actinomycetes bacterium]
MRSRESLARIIAVAVAALAPLTLLCLLIVHVLGGKGSGLLQVATVVVALLSGLVLVSTWWRHEQAPLQTFLGPSRDRAAEGLGAVEAVHALPDVLASSPVVFAVYDATGTCLLMDGAVVQRSGVTGVASSLEQLRAEMPTIADALETALAGGHAYARHEGSSSLWEARFAPLWRDGRVVGAVGCAADITNQQRVDQQRERTTRQQGALARVLGTAAYARLDVEAVAQSIADLAVEEIGECCDVRLVEDDGVRMRVVAVQHVDLAERGTVTQMLQTVPLRVGVGIGGRAVATGRPVRAPRGDPQLLAHVTPGAAPQTAAIPVGAYLAFPLRSGGRILGTLALHRRRGHGEYSREDVAFAEDLASRAAIAIDATLLYRDVQRESEQRRALAEQVARSLDRQRELLQQLLDTEERERSRLAEDIHDDPLQVLVAALLRIGLVRSKVDGELRDQLSLVESTLEDVGLRLRRVMFDLTPPDLGGGLAAAVRRLS